MHQHFLKSSTQNCDQKNRSNLPSSERKVYLHDIISELNETSNFSEATYDVDSPASVMMAIMMSRKGNVNKHYDDSNANLTSNADHIITSESCAKLSPEEQDILHSLTNEKKAFILENVRFKHNIIPLSLKKQ